MTRTDTATPAATAGIAPLDVFALRDSVVDEYKRFATSFTTIHATDIREQVDAIYDQDRYWPEPLIQINPNYKRTTDIGALVENGVLARGCEKIFRKKEGPLSLYKHQEEAIALAKAGESFVVTTGHRVRQVALLLRPDRQPRAGCPSSRRRALHQSHRRLSDERAGKLADGGTRQVHRPSSGRPPRHLRPLHGAGRRGRAQADIGKPAGHPTDQLHDARAPHDPAGGGRPPGHAQLRGSSSSSSSTSCTRTGGRQGADVALLVRRVPGATPARGSPVHRHIGHHGQRGVARAQESRGRRRDVPSSSGAGSKRTASLPRRWSASPIQTKPPTP